jgi:AraC-like DNA-binding protein
LFIKSALLRILAVLSANNLFEVTEKNHDRRIETIKTTLTYIQENYKEKIYIRDLADLIGMNEQYFCRFFKKVIGRSPMEYVNEYRIKKAIHYLKESDLTVTEICLECGYNNLGNFLREFRKYTSTTPLQYRRHLLKETQ